MGAAEAANLLGPLLGNLLGGSSSNKAANWGQSALINVLNTMNQANQVGQQMGGAYSQPAGAIALQNGQLGQGILNGENGGLASQQNSAYQAGQNLNPSQFQGGDATSQLMQLLASPQGSQLMSQLSTLGNNKGILNDNQGFGQQFASNLLQGTEQGQQGMLGIGQTLGANGGLTNVLDRLGIDGAGAVDNGGRTAETQGGMTAAQGILANGGVTSALEALSKAGVGGLSGAMGTPGLTNTGASGERSALSGLNSGGQTDFTRQLQGIGANYAAQPALIPTALAASMARDQAGANATNAAQNAQAQALARGGGPGATVANGARNAGLADFSNQIAQAQSKAYQDAITQQQGLNLQQQGQGAQMGLGAANTAAQQLGTYSGLLNNLEGTANQRYGISSNNVSAANAGANNNVGTGLSGITGLQNANTNLAGTYGNLATGASNATVARANAGSSALNDYLSSILQGGNLMNSQQGLQLQALLGANSGYNNSLNSQGGLLSGAAGLNQQGTNSFNNALNNYLNTGNNVNSTGAGLVQTGLGALNGLSNNWLDYAKQGLAGQSNLFQSYASNGLNNASQANQTSGITGGKFLGGLADWATGGASGGDK